MIQFAAIFFISRTLYCYVSINIVVEDCSQPLYFSMHAKEKKSRRGVGVGAEAGVQFLYYSTRATTDVTVNSLLI